MGAVLAVAGCSAGRWEPQDELAGSGLGSANSNGANESSDDEEKDGDASEQTSQETTPSDPNEESEGTPSEDWDRVGQCRLAGDGVYANATYAGVVAYLLIGEQGSGSELCRVEFDLTSVADPEVPCDSCYWSTVVEQSNPQVVVDLEGTCGDSERGLDPAAIDSLAGQRTGMGFAEEDTGHGDVLMVFDPGTQRWGIVAFGSWDQETGQLWYEKSEGFCEY